MSFRDRWFREVPGGTNAVDGYAVASSIGKRNRLRSARRADWVCSEGQSGWTHGDL